MDKLILDLIKEGKNANEILKMPYGFMVDLMREKNKPEESSSFFDLV